MMKKTLINKIKEIFFLLLYCFLLYICTYVIKYDNVFRSIYIGLYLIRQGAIQYIIISYLIIVLVELIIKSIVKENWKTNIISTILILIITIISYYKYQILELPFLPSDILLIGNINQIAEFGLTFLPINTVLILLVLFGILIVQYLINKENNTLKTQKTIKNNIFRIVMFIIGTILLYDLCINPNRYSKFNIKNDLGDNYSWMGGNAVFFMHLGDFYTINPDGYNSENIKNIEQETLENKEIKEKAINNPNVIMIMNESFTNPNLIKNVNYSVNPIKNIENLVSEDKNCIMRKYSNSCFCWWYFLARI